MATYLAFAATFLLSECPPACGVSGSQSIAVQGVMKRPYETRPGATPKIRAWKDKMLTVLNRDTKISGRNNPGASLLKRQWWKKKNRQTSLTASVQHYFDWGKILKRILKNVGAIGRKLFCHLRDNSAEKHCANAFNVLDHSTKGYVFVLHGIVRKQS